MKLLVVVACLALSVMASAHTSFTMDIPPMKPAIIDGPPGADPGIMKSINAVLKAEPASASFAPVAEDPNGEDIFALDPPVPSDAAGTGAAQDEIAAANDEEKNLRDEMQVLKQLIERGDAIVQAMPQKKKRLAELAKRFNVAEDSIGVHKAEAQLEQQQQLLKDIDAKIAEMEAKLTELKDTKSKLEESIAKTTELEKKAEAQLEKDENGGGDEEEGDAEEEEEEEEEEEGDAEEEEGDGEEAEGDAEEEEGDGEEEEEEEKKR